MPQEQSTPLPTPVLSLGLLQAQLLIRQQTHGQQLGRAQGWPMSARGLTSPSPAPWPP